MLQIVVGVEGGRLVLIGGKIGVGWGDTAGGRFDEHEQRADVGRGGGDEGDLSEGVGASGICYHVDVVGVGALGGGRSTTVPETGLAEERSRRERVSTSQSAFFYGMWSVLYISYRQ